MLRLGFAWFYLGFIGFSTYYWPAEPAQPSPARGWLVGWLVGELVGWLAGWLPPGRYGTAGPVRDRRAGTGPPGRYGTAGPVQDRRAGLQDRQAGRQD